MLILLSPAKTLDFDKTDFGQFTQAEFQTEMMSLARILKQYSAVDLKSLMSISDNLAEENRMRFKSMKKGHSTENAKQAILAFKGDVYRGLEAEDFDQSDLNFAQDHLRILSGLYGVLRPLDLIQPYRLEMGTSLKTKKGNNLYDYWDQRITKSLNKVLEESQSKVIINLASQEYFKSVKVNKLKAPLLEVNFKEMKDGQFKFISFNAKKARGLMARYIIKHKLTDTSDLKSFDVEGYGFSAEYSNDNQWLFIR
jgi:cytoplasmic iron level regulating protein YaaA (DUF328/UPF0246 family)